ncbi:Hypothetical predicted protein [Podarcis lilfordi]|uniref:Uncharacterized protein n=1 Tax=Podarcis lilfordi TaxID=74358 RepID=A0AA35LCN5_9SAUR|nr:Hypothetical predicted protein [Podarcis lilfordi]
MCRIPRGLDERTGIEIQVQQADPILEGLSGDDLFLFCVGFTCEKAYNEGEDSVEYNKDAVSMVIMDIMGRWTQFPNPVRILKRGMEDIIRLTFMKPPFMQSKKSAIIHGTLFPIAHTYGLNNAEKEALAYYFTMGNEAERDMATSSTHVLLEHALRSINLTRTSSLQLWMCSQY